MKVNELIGMLQPYGELELVVWDSSIQRYVPMEPKMDMTIEIISCTEYAQYHPSLVGKTVLQLEIVGE